MDCWYFDACTAVGRRVPFATVASLAFAAAATLSAYYAGSDMILASLGAEKLDSEIPEQREFHNVVTEMALASGSKMPKVYVIYDPAPNALATGTNDKNTAICVTTGLLTLLSREETQGVVAHEMSHIRNKDVLLMTLVSILVGGIAILADGSRRVTYSSRVGRRVGEKLFLLPALLLIILSPIIAQVLAMAVSRQREYLADATAVEYTRNPLGLAKALEKIRSDGMAFQRATRGTAHLFFVNPLARRLESREGFVADLLSSHPPINRRILLLYQMAGLPTK